MSELSERARLLGDNTPLPESLKQPRARRRFSSLQIPPLYVLSLSIFLYGMGTGIPTTTILGTDFLTSLLVPPLLAVLNKDRRSYVLRDYTTPFLSLLVRVQ